MVRLSTIVFLVVAVFSQISAQSQDQVNRLRLAQEFTRNGEYARSARLFEGLIESDSLNYVYFSGLSEDYVMLRRFDDAIALSLARLRRMPNDVNTMAELGSIYYRADDSTRADSMWSAVIALGPRNAGIYRAVALVQMDLRLFDRTIATLRTGREKIGDKGLFAGDLASLYSLMMEYGPATREYVTILKQNEGQLGYVESRIGLYTTKEEGLKAALDVVRSASADSPDNIALERLLGWLYEEAQEYDRAFTVAKSIEEKVNSGGTELMSFAEHALHEKAYTAAANAYRYVLDRYPAAQYRGMARLGYARTLEELGREADSTRDAVSRLERVPAPYTGAVSEYAAIAAEYPRSEIAAEALYRIGMIRYDVMFDLDGAMAMLDSVLRVMPRSAMVPSVLTTTGDIALARGDLKAAGERYRMASASPLATPEQRRAAQFDLAEVEYFLHNTDSASLILGTITRDLASDEANDALDLGYFITENAAFPAALRRFADAGLLERERKLTEALAVYQEIDKEYPGAPLADDALLRSAELEGRLLRPGEALAAYRKLLDEYPHSTLRDRAQFGIAEVYQFRLHDTANAIKAYEEILASYPQSLLTDTARKRIRRLRGDTPTSAAPPLFRHLLS